MGQEELIPEPKLLSQPTPIPTSNQETIKNLESVLAKAEEAKQNLSTIHSKKTISLNETLTEISEKGSLLNEKLQYAEKARSIIEIQSPILYKELSTQIKENVAEARKNIDSFSNFARDKLQTIFDQIGSLCALTANRRDLKPLREELNSLATKIYDCSITPQDLLDKVLCIHSLLPIYSILQTHTQNIKDILNEEIGVINNFKKELEVTASKNITHLNNQIDFLSPDPEKKKNSLEAELLVVLQDLQSFITNQKSAISIRCATKLLESIQSQLPIYSTIIQANEDKMNRNITELVTGINQLLDEEKPILLTCTHETLFAARKNQHEKSRQRIGQTVQPTHP